MGAVVAAVMADGEYAPPAYEKKYDGYFQYANVPGDTEYEFRYNRGNPSHKRNPYEQSKDSRFHTKAIISFILIVFLKFKFFFAQVNGEHGEHYWEHNHADYAPAFAAPAYSELAATYEQAPAKF